MNLNKKIKRSKLKMFTKDLSFFGIQSYKFNWTFEEFNENLKDVFGYVEFNSEDGSLESGKIHFNSEMFENEKYDHVAICYTAVHELLHILNKHGIRKETRKHDVWAVACDHVVEREMRNMKKFLKCPLDTYHIIGKLDNDLPKCTTVQAYNWLLENQELIKIEQNCSNDMVNVTNNKSGEKMFSVSPTQGGNTKDKNMEQISQETDKFISEARAIFEDMKNKGAISDNLSQFLSKLLRVEIPWEELLEKAIKTNTIMKPDGRSWRSVNKFFQPHGITLPGYTMEESNEGIGTLIIGVDTSGSISKKELKKFSYIIEQSMKYFKTIKVLIHDVKIHQEKDFDRDNILAFYSFISNEGYKGRGGTSHGPLFKRIDELWDENSDDISMVISLTDLYSDVESLYKNQKFIKENCPLIFLINSGRKIPLDKFGEINQIIIK